MNKPAKWITIAYFSQLTGMSIGAIRGKINRGKWKPGKVFQKSADNGILFNLEAYYEWVESEGFYGK